MPTLYIENYGLVLPQQSSAPASPSSGYDTLYIDTSDRPWIKTSAGVLIPLASGPMFSVNKAGSDQTGIVTATDTLVTWSGTEVYDTHNYFASNRYTPLVAGKYGFYFLEYMSAMVDQKLLEAIIEKNGTAIARGRNRASGTGGVSSAVYIEADMNGTTDYVEAWCFHDNGSNSTLLGSAVYTLFCGGLRS